MDNGPKRSERSDAKAKLGPLTRTAVALSGVSFFATLVGYTDGGSAAFSIYGAIKQVAVPASLACIIVGLGFAMIARRRASQPLAPPLIVVAGVLILLSSIAFNLFGMGVEPTSVRFLAQDLGAFVLFATSTWLGSLADTQDISKAFKAFLGFSALQPLLRQAPVPLGSLPGAAVGLCVYLIFGRKLRWPWVPLFLIVFWLLADPQSRFRGVETQRALRVEVGMSLLLGSYLAARRFIRVGPLATGFAVLGAALILGYSSTGALVFQGRYEGADVTLAQRAYEANAVSQLQNSSLLGFLFGSGPGSSVDLSKSPDAATLYASGRDLLHVPNVHLLTAQLRLKYGVLGELWLISMAAILVKRFAGSAAQGMQGASGPDMALIVAASSLVYAIPAGANLFTDPMFGISLGVLSASRRVAPVCASVK